MNSTAKAESARTPGPWEVLPQNGAGPVLAHRYETGKQMQPTGLRLIAHMLERGSSLSEDQANAAFIVTACNAHNKLVSALRDLLEQIDCLDDISYSRDVEPYKAEANWQDTYDRACTVLKEVQS